MAQPPIVNLIATAARQRGVDPAAALAVARQEGLSGAVGDQGTSFGPFQLHYGGAYPASAPHGPGSQAWAMSPAGVGYALDQINHVAHGEHGAQAIRDIVSRFERPANPAREIANALAAYGGQESYAGTPPQKIAYGQTPSGRMLVGGTPPQDNRRQLLLALANSVGQKSPDYTPLLTQLLARREAPQAARPTPIPNATQPATAQPIPGAPSGQHVLAELLHEGVGGPTHSTGDHIHAALTDPQAMLAAIREAQQLGLSVRENPYVDPVDPVHAPNSFHKRDFPGLYNGRKLGEAIDVSGPRELEFQQWVQRRYGR